MNIIPNLTFLDNHNKLPKNRGFSVFLVDDKMYERFCTKIEI